MDAVIGPFYDVKNELYKIAEKINIEIQDGYCDENCDYEGDLEEITVYHGARGHSLICEILEYYEIDAKIADEMNLVLSIF